MSAIVNALRGEASLIVNDIKLVFRPTFTALIAAEAEIGPLFATIEQAAAGKIKLGDLVALLWHCLAPGAPPLTRESFAEAVVQAGMSTVTPVLKTLLTQILAGK